MILVDTDVLVDVMRRHGPAVEWLDSLGTEVIGIPGLVAMELLQGCRNREEQDELERFLRSYQRHWPTQADCSRAFDDFAAYYLSHDLGILDALIAETAVGLNTLGDIQHKALQCCSECSDPPTVRTGVMRSGIHSPLLAEVGGSTSFAIEDPLCPNSLFRQSPTAQSD